MESAWLGVNPACVSLPDAFASSVTSACGVPDAAHPVQPFSTPEHEPSAAAIVMDLPAVPPVARFHQVVALPSADCRTMAQALPPLSLSLIVGPSAGFTLSRLVTEISRITPDTAPAGIVTENPVVGLPVGTTGVKASAIGMA